MIFHEMNKEELTVVKQLDDGTLYAAPIIIMELFKYPDMQQAELKISRDQKGKAQGYLPVGCFNWNPEGVLSYIPAMSNSPPISATYPPGADYVLSELASPYLDNDIVAQSKFSLRVPTASAYCLPLVNYWSFLSTSRRKDFRRKLKKADQFTVHSGNLTDIHKAWHWMQKIWEQRGRFGSTPYEVYLDETLSWLQAIEQSGRATLKIDTYWLGKQRVGVNCCVIHRYHKHYHCDDYLTWYNPNVASGLGIVSAIKNLTHPAMKGYRYNLGTPGFLNKTYGGHEYKWHIIPKPIRLTQSVVIRNRPDLIY